MRGTSFGKTKEKDKIVIFYRVYHRPIEEVYEYTNYIILKEVTL